MTIYARGREADDRAGPAFKSAKWFEPFPITKYSLDEIDEVDGVT